MCFLPRSSGGDNDTRIPSKVCGDHGDCHSLPGGNFSCSCHDGYTGERCRDGMSAGYYILGLVITVQHGLVIAYVPWLLHTWVGYDILWLVIK